ncbi:hypothetical protein TWF696_009275 [Orbilia brochopaga]|uniref:Ubiquitin-like domain-containing protein n=1 Tax=Orbilia brochopaga TaxID=3140254 RepID=A0AAV9UGY7_9PEZI
MATKMSEVDFAKSILLGLSSRPCTISPDHVEDPRKLPARSLFTLPKLPTTMAKPAPPRDPSAPPAATIHLKTLRPPQIINESLPSTPLTTTIQAIKATITSKTAIPADKLRLMIKGKILGDAKTLSEIVEDGGEVTISVMVTGGYTPATASATAVPDAAAVAEKVEKAETAEDVVKMEVDSEVGDVVKVLEGEAFWRDLEVFLRQKVGTEAAAREVADVFRKAWGSR